jgi:Protein of unknown function (DUF1573)
LSDVLAATRFSHFSVFEPVMKKLLLIVLLAVAIGVTSGWAVNHNRYGKRTARFGPFTMDREITPDNVIAHITKDIPVGKAKVELDGETTFNFGMMSPNAKGEHVFKIRNVGTDNLTLRLGATTCACTLGELDKASLAPGEETDIKLSWTVKPGEAEFQQTAQVITNDPKRVVITLGITGQVVSEVSLVPDTWTFDRVTTGEDFQFSGTIYNFMANDIKHTTSRFSAPTINDLAEITVEEYEPTEEKDGIRHTARQAFTVTMKIKAGLRQGAVSQNLVFGFKKLDDQGNEITDDPNVPNGEYFLSAPVQGSVIGHLSMITNSKLTGDAEEGYEYDFGKVSKDGEFTGKAFVVLRGEERENTKLSIGEVVPNKYVKATLGEPSGRGSMTLYPLEIELIPGTEPIERLGKNKDDYGAIWIESDNPKVTRMRVILKFSLEAQ